MNLKEAYAMLELEQSSSPEEAKKKYRALTKKWHPDVNKEPDAEVKFKKINEAYQCIQAGKGNDRSPSFQRNQNPFDQSHSVQLGHIEVNISIDFKESVIGTKKEIKYSRNGKCSKCDGVGEIPLNNGCLKCGGMGRTIIRQSGSVFISSCPSCMGKTNATECIDCNGDGTLNTDVSVHVSVPAGVINGNVLRLQNMGHFAGTFMGLTDQHTDVFCHINVIPEKDLSIIGKDVVTTINISLLEALKGRMCTVKTIYGTKEIKVEPKSRNQDEVIIPHLGVGGIGNQRVILNVNYPENIDKLIDALVDEVT